jgi:hypothetical protein
VPTPNFEQPARPTALLLKERLRENLGQNHGDNAVAKTQSGRVVRYRGFNFGPTSPDEIKQ